MRELNGMELNCVSGGNWELELNGGVISVTLSGDESVQDMAAAVANVASSTYWAARDATADLFEWMAIGWEYSARCGQ